MTNDFYYLTWLLLKDVALFSIGQWARVSGKQSIYRFIFDRSQRTQNKAQGKAGIGQTNASSSSFLWPYVVLVFSPSLHSPSFTHSLKRKKGEKETEENKGQVDNEKEGGRERRGLMNIHCLGPFCSVLPSTHRFFLFSSFSKSLSLYQAVDSPNPPSFFLFNFNLSLLKLKTRHHHHRFGLNFSFFFLIFIFKTKLFFQKKTQRGNYLCSNQILLVSPLTMFIN